MKKLLLVFLCFLSHLLLFSQEYYYRQFTTQNGLPTKTIYEIYCADDGFIWMGSDIGLIRYDGREFKLFTTDDGLPDTEVLHVFGDAQNRIWGITFSNRIFYMQNEKVFTQKEKPFLKKIDSIGTQYNAILRYDVYNTGEIFFYIYERILKLRGEEITEVSPKGTQPVSIQNVFRFKNEVYALSSLGSSNQIYRLAEQGFVPATGEILPAIVDYPAEEKNYYLQKDSITNDGRIAGVHTGAEWYKPNIISKLYVDRNENLWYYANNKGIKLYANNRWSSLLSQYRFSFITQDFEGNYWLSTVNNGVLFLESDFLNKLLLEDNIGKEVKTITSVFIDNHNRIFTGDEFSKLTVYEDTGTFHAMHLVNKNTYCRILNIQYANTFFINTDDGLFEVEYSQNNLHIKSKPGMVVAGKGISIANNNTLFLAYASGLNKITRNALGWSDEIIFSGRTFSCVVTPDSVTWFSTPSGLYIYNQKQVSQLNVPEINGLRIVDILYNPNDKTLLLSTDGYGVFVFDIDSKKISNHFSEDDGLTTNLCRKMQLVHDTLYVATPQGLNRIKLSAGKSEILPALHRENGLPSDDIKCFYVKNNTLAVGGDFGVLVWKNFLSPRQLIKPILHITKIITDKGEYGVDEKSTVTFENGKLRIYYSAIRYIADPPLLEYKIDNNTWQTQAGGVLEIQNLSPGNHTISFRLQGDTDEEIHVHRVFIQAPFYKQTWFIPVFIICIALVAASAIIYMLYNRKQKAIEKLRLNEKLVFAEQQAMQAMMNPHFIFNAINSVQQYIIQNDIKEANRYLTQFARLIRSNLETAKQKYITLEEEIERLSLYLQFEKIRFREKLNYTIFISPELETDRLRIPSMVIQPFVENAIWHGIVPLQKNGSIIISAFAENNSLKILVEDDGTGYKPKTETLSDSTKTSLGINITRKRLQLLSEDTGLQHNFSIEPRITQNGQADGTKVIITFPLLTDTIR